MSTRTSPIRLLAELPADLRRDVTEILTTLEEEKWPYATSYARARFLLTIQLNDNDPEVVGAALFELGLVPDLELFADPALLRTRTGLNIRQMEILTRPDRPERQRVLELGLTDAAFRARLAAFVAEIGLDDPREWTRRIVVDRRTGLCRSTAGRSARDRGRGHPHNRRRPGTAARRRPARACRHPLLQNLGGQPFLVAGAARTEPACRSASRSSRTRGASLASTGLARRSCPRTLAPPASPLGEAVTTGRSGYNVTFRKLRGSGLEQGWHYVRILPHDDEGIALPVDPPAPGPGPGERERTLLRRHAIRRDDDLEDVLPPERAEIYPGVSQAPRALEFRALGEGRGWRAVQCHSAGWKGSHAGGRNVLRASFGPHGVAEIPLSPALRDIQRQISPNPSGSTRWAIRVDARETAWFVRDEMDSSRDRCRARGGVPGSAGRGAARHPRR